MRSDGMLCSRVSGLLFHVCAPSALFWEAMSLWTIQFLADFFEGLCAHIGFACGRCGWLGSVWPDLTWLVKWPCPGCTIIPTDRWHAVQACSSNLSTSSMWWTLSRRARTRAMRIRFASGIGAFRRNLALQYFRPAIIVLRMHMVHGTGYGAQDEEEASSEKFLATSHTHRHIQVPSESKLRSARDMGNYCSQTSAFRALWIFSWGLHIL